MALEGIRSVTQVGHRRVIVERCRAYAPILIEQGVAGFGALVFHVVAARVYGAAMYAWLFVVWGGVAFGVLVYRAALGVPFVVEHAGLAPGGRRVAVRSLALATQWVQLALCLGAGIMLAAAHMLAEPIRVKLAVGASGALLLAAMLDREMRRHLLLADLRNVRAAAVGVSAAAVGTLAFVMLSIGGSGSPALAVTSLAAGAYVGGWLLRPRQEIRSCEVNVVPHIRAWWRLGAGVLAGVMAVTGGAQAMIWILMFQHGAEAVASLGAAVAIIGLPRPAFSALTTVLTPRVAHRVESEGRQAGKLALPSRRWVAAVIVTTVTGVIVAVGVGSILTEALFPTVAPPSKALLAVLCIMVLCEGVASVTRGLLRGSRRTHVEGVASVAAMTGAVLVSIPLCYRLGALGAGMAMLVMQAGFVMTTYVHLRASRGLNDATPI
jgi:hypothetical protein